MAVTLPSSLLASVPATLVAALLVPLAARADDPPKIVSSNYSLDLFQGPVTAATRVIGLAGAYAALAEWCEGEYSNTASPAVRAPYSLGKWDYDVCLGFTNPGALAGNDFENRGEGFDKLPTRFSNSITLNAGLELQYGTVGVTVVYDQIRFGLSQDVNSATDSVVINRVSASIANAFLDEQLVLGVGLRAATFVLDQQVVAGVRETVVSSGGTSAQLGAILKPRRSPFRLGATIRNEIDVTDVRGTSQLADGSQVVGTPPTQTILPSRIIVPWEFEVGGALELGRRPLNPPRLDTTHAEDTIRARFDDARLERARHYVRELEAAKDREALRRRFEIEELTIERQEDDAIDSALDELARMQKARARLWDRRQTLLLLSVLVTGNIPNAVGISDFLSQRNIASGSSIVVSPRLAMETEAIKDWLTVRGGTYFEPARYADAFAREHMTLGVDVRLLEFNPWGIFGQDPWRIRLAADLSARYFNYGVSLGKYH
jgi:hypothetical protein